MSDEITKKKWNEIYSENISSQMQPTYVLSEYSYLLPNSGKALDVACGLGVNTIFLVQHGLQVHAWDISEQAIDQLQDSIRILRPWYAMCMTSHLKKMLLMWFV